ncbi:class I SAM-dependent methyltransferase [uncultured Enterovirga sp.]|uniref:class I SAM-dependent methyltransferase n=1 Tax=uncultured Enterovirga sp. TaxID=2026352 RepID=UPI0035C98396
MPPAPLCPITRRPAFRHVQWISTRFLADLWRYGGRVDVADLLRPAGPRLGLWESPTGLMFFDPPIAGDAAFYQRFYEHLGAHEKLTGPKTVRREFQMAAAQVLPGDRILDVGCGLGGFRAYVPEAGYTGIDPHFGGHDPNGAVLAVGVEEHAAQCGPVYDVVCAFQVIEHVPDPLGFVRAMVACLRPGGRLILGVPFWPSPNTTIPNFIINAPPHHLTWWSKGSLEALARELGLEPDHVRPVEMSRHEALIYWMAKVTPIRCSKLFFAPKVSWHVALAVSYAIARAIYAVCPLPSRTGPNALLLVARKGG